jgi:A/G-specific adenine glycosylase
LVSEVMLQQTQAGRVVPAFRSFLRRFPTVRTLAAAPRRDVVREWGGLGYNRRAVRLSEAARAIVRDHGGRIPRDPSALRELPGVGPYTAAAVASLGFGEPVAVVDTNVAASWLGCTWGRRSRRAGEAGVGRSPTRGSIETIRSRGTRR